MTKTCSIQPTRLGLLMYEGAQQAAIHGLADVFFVAERVALGLGMDTPIVTVRQIDDANKGADVDAIIVPPNLTGKRPDPAEWTVQRIAALARKDALICSVCAGAFWLAAAGVLDGHRATTHWALDEELRRSHPKIDVDASQIVLQDRNRVTAGGVMAWTDLGVHLLNMWYGPAVTAMVARQLVLDVRTRDQASYGSFSPPTDHKNPAILRVQNEIARNYNARLTISDMAAFCGMSERTFVRQFKAAVGMTPNAYVQRVRVEEARLMLETSRQPIGAVAYSVGYADAAAFTKVFSAWLGVTPGDYRKHSFSGHDHI